MLLAHKLNGLMVWDRHTATKATADPLTVADISQQMTLFIPAQKTKILSLQLASTISLNASATSPSTPPAALGETTCGHSRTRPRARLQGRVNGSVGSLFSTCVS